MTTTTAKLAPIVFCNIAWHPRYDGTEPELLINGGKYVKENQDGGELENFMPTLETNPQTGEQVTMLNGYYYPKSNRGTVNQTRIERIHGCAMLKHEDYADGVTVVWCATTPMGNSVVVGWYKNATVCRRYNTIEIHYDDGTSYDRWYNIYAKYEDAVLLPVKERVKPKWRIPRKSKQNPIPFGFGQANIWYASEEEAKDFVVQMLQQIEAYDGPDAKPKI